MAEKSNELNWKHFLDEGKTLGIDSSEDPADFEGKVQPQNYEEWGLDSYD